MTSARVRCRLRLRLDDIFGGRAALEVRHCGQLAAAVRHLLSGGGQVGEADGGPPGASFHRLVRAFGDGSTLSEADAQFKRLFQTASTAGVRGASPMSLAPLMRVSQGVKVSTAAATGGSALSSYGS